MDTIYPLIIFIVYALFAGKFFDKAIYVFVLLLPTYLIKFSLFGLPTTFLEIMLLAIVFIWLIKYGYKDSKGLLNSFKKNKLLYGLMALFFIFSIGGICVSGDIFKAIGLWRAYFLEPIIFFLIVVASRKRIENDKIIFYLFLSTLSISFYAFFQKITGIGITSAQWVPAESRRVTAFFNSPNAIGLYLSPIIMMMIGILADKKDRVIMTSVWCFKKIKEKKQVYWLMFLFAGLAVGFAKSHGALVGLSVGVVVFLFILGYRKIVLLLVVIAILVIFTMPPLRSSLMFEDQAGKNRLLLWSQSCQFLTNSSANFIFGSGIRNFYDKVQKPNHDWNQIERLIYPHNILLNFWTEIGLFGAIFFGSILLYLFYICYKISKQDKVVGATLFSTLMVVLVHGIVDVPYFKNDLSFLFWILTLIIMNKYWELNIYEDSSKR